MIVSIPAPKSTASIDYFFQLFTRTGWSLYHPKDPSDPVAVPKEIGGVLTIVLELGFLQLTLFGRHKAKPEYVLLVCCATKKIETYQSKNFKER